MEKKLTLASWVILLVVAIWQAPGWWKSKTDPAITTNTTVNTDPVVQDTPLESLGPRNPDYKSRDPKTQYTLDLRDYKQNDKFVRSPFNAEDGGEVLLNGAGNSGPLDANGNLIMPLDMIDLH